MCPNLTINKYNTYISNFNSSYCLEKSDYEIIILTIYSLYNGKISGSNLNEQFYQN